MAIAAKPTFRTDAFIDGAFRPAPERRAIRDREPGHRRAQLDTVAAGDAADIDLAVAAARRAFDDGRWSHRSPAERKAVLLRLADLIEANAEELAMLDSLEAGKPITDCRETDLPETIKTFRWYAEAADKLYDSIAPTGRDALGHDHPRADRRGRGGPAVELPDHDGGLEGGAGPRGRQHRWSSSRRSSPRSRPSGSPSSPRRPASRTASSTSSRVSARRPARRSAGTRTSTARRSPARPRSGACSSATRRRAT